MITEQQRANRIKHIGSSDVPAILGRSRFANAHDVYLEKIGAVEIEQSAAHLTAGSYREVGLLQWAEDQLGPIKRNQYRSRPDLHLGCHLDGIHIETTRPIEGKSLSLYGGRLDEFGEPGTDAIPEDVILQASSHMISLEDPKTGKHPDKAWIPLDHPSLSLQMYVVDWDDNLVAEIKDSCLHFWSLVESRTPPPDIPCLQSLKARSREPGKIVEVDPELVTRFQETKASALENKKAYEAAEAELLTAIGDGDCADGGPAGMVTYHQRKGASRPDRDQMKLDNIWDKYAIPGKPFRVAVYRQPKED